MARTLDQFEAQALADKANEHSVSFGTLFVCHDGGFEYYRVAVGGTGVYQPITRAEAAALLASIEANLCADEPPFVRDAFPVATGPATPPPPADLVADVVFAAIKAGRPTYLNTRTTRSVVKAMRKLVQRPFSAISADRYVEIDALAEMAGARERFADDHARAYDWRSLFDYHQQNARAFRVTAARNGFSLP